MIKITIGNNIRRTSDIIDENTTLRTALEAHEIDYTCGMTSLDGCTLQPGDLDKTFADFGVTDRCYLLNVVKAENAASIKVLGATMMVVSAAGLDAWKKVQQYEPDALVVYGYDEDTEKPVPKFRAGIGSGAGSISRYGVSFSDTPDAAGKAVVTTQLPEGTGDVAEYILNTYGDAITRLEEVEAEINAVVSSIDSRMNALRAKITTL